MKNEYVDEELAIGIDLGTTNSCMAVMRNNKVEIIPSEIGENITPSVVSFIDEGVLVGENTFNQLLKNPKNTIYSIKRIIGRKYSEIEENIKSHFWSYDIEKTIEGEPQIKIIKNGIVNYYSPEEISTLILKKLLKSATEYLGKPVTKIVITVPAYFNNAQREATKNAAISAGCKVLYIISEPTAASLAYGLDKIIPKKKENEIDSLVDPNEKILNKEDDNNFGLINEDKIDNIINENKINGNYIKNENEKLVLVFDLGGGTFDVTLLQIIDKGNFNILSTNGISNLGGDDFNKKIMDYFLEDFCKKFNFKQDDIKKDSIAMNRLKIASENAKICLSYEEKISIRLEDFYKNEMLNIESFTKKEFEEICNDLFIKLIPPLDKVLENVGKGPSEINEIVLVGGSTRIPRIKEIIKNYFFEKININDYINPDETVAYGASILAAKLMRQGSNILNDVILLDITPFSIGIEVHNNSKIKEIKNKGNLMSIIIPKGKKIPIKKTVKNYQTIEDFQRNGWIRVYEGDNKYVKDNHLLGEFILKDLPRRRKGEVKIDVTISIDVNGIVSVKAVETSERLSNSIDIINNKGIKEKEIKQKFDYIIMTKDSEYIKSYKKELNEYYKNYKEAYKPEYKYSFMLYFSRALVGFIGTFDLEGNDTLGNKYFLYIKTLFESYKILLEFEDKYLLQNKKEIIENCKNALKILIKFKNINSNNFIKLFQFFVLESRKDFLFELVVFAMELLEEKAKGILSNKNIKFSRYNSKYIFNNCIELSELFIPYKKDLDPFPEIKNKHDKCLNNCKKSLNEINAESLVNISKKNVNIFEFLRSKNREEILLILDNYSQGLEFYRQIKDYSSIAINLSYIIRIKYKILNIKDYKRIKSQTEECINLARQYVNDFRRLNWFKEVSDIDKEIQEILNKKKSNNSNEKWESISKEIEEYKEKGTLEFINYILEKYPPQNPINGNKINEQEWNERKNNFLIRLQGAYSPNNIYNPETEEEILKYKIYNSISEKLNEIDD